MIDFRPFSSRRQRRAVGLTAAAAAAAVFCAGSATPAVRAAEPAATAPKAAAAAAASPSFALKDGDRICFYGDSITDQRMYTLLTEDYLVTRFPKMNLSFVHSGWGGDRVTGGGGGSIDTRLARDVVPYKPTVVTIMLGMNDASYRAYDEKIFQTYQTGMQHIVDSLRHDLPGVRLTFIQPSPYDDVTRAPGWNPGYNTVLVGYGDYLKKVAATTPGASAADLNTPTVAMLEKAKASNPDLATKIVPDRIHPAWGGHLVMAQGLLQSWGMPSLVSTLEIRLRSPKDGDLMTMENGRINKTVERGTDGTLTWTSTEDALPFPLPNDPKDEEFKLALASSDFIDTLDREMLTVSGLTAPSYTLTIDGAEVASFTREQWAAGVNLAPLPTPMLAQARAVDALTRRRIETHNLRWRTFQVPYAGDAAVAPSVGKVLDSLDRLDADLAKERKAAAQPKPHTFRLVPKA